MSNEIVSLFLLTAPIAVMAVWVCALGLHRFNDLKEEFTTIHYDPDPTEFNEPPSIKKERVRIRRKRFLNDPISS